MKQVTVTFQESVVYTFKAKSYEADNADIVLLEKDFTKENRDLVAITIKFMDGKITVRYRKLVLIFDFAESDFLYDNTYNGTSLIGDISIHVEGTEDDYIDDEYPDGDELFKALCKKIDSKRY